MLHCLNAVWEYNAGGMEVRIVRVVSEELACTIPEMERVIDTL
jgi:hypothetical protein